jgi:hypothetical protein
VNVLCSFCASFYGVTDKADMDDTCYL